MQSFAPESSLIVPALRYMKVASALFVKYACSVTSAEQLLLNLHPAPISNELALNFPVTAKSAFLLFYFTLH